MTLAVVQAIADVSYRKLVAGLEATHLDPLAVDPDPVGAPQVADDDFPVLLHHAAMMPGDAERIEPRIAGRVTSHDHHGAVQHDIRTFVECHKPSGHRNGSWDETSGGRSC